MLKLDTFLPYDQVFWYLSQGAIAPLRQDVVADVVIVGGGMAGLSAAQIFRQQGLRVTLVEKNYCGSGASGKSSGFITPDSELSLHDLVRLYGPAKARSLWEWATGGMQLIKKNIHDFNIDCDYQVQDTLIVATTDHALRHDLTNEDETRRQLGYSSALYTAETVRSVIGSESYHGGLRYGDTYGIQAYRYCQAMKKVLQDQGVQIYEESPAIDIQDHLVRTPAGTVKAEHVVVCSDYNTADLMDLRYRVYPVQTFLALSAPLTDAQVHQIFPESPCMVWDTDLIYHYYRVTGQNRLMVGGAGLWATYAGKEWYHNRRIMRHLSAYMKTRFPAVSLQFDYMWPGLIGVSRDLVPLAGYHEKFSSVYCIAAAAGLPWAAALGRYGAQRILQQGLDDFDDILSWHRAVPLGSLAPRLLGKRLTFALSNFMTIGSL